jgi:uncharacterized repeat protein (TIGR03803 family)
MLFTGTNGSQPQGDLYLGENGHLYGTAAYGGTNVPQFSQGNGTVFEITTDGVLINLITLNLTNDANPAAGFVEGTDGNLYTTTSLGGAGPPYEDSTNGDGTVLRLTTNGELDAIASFNSTNGFYPEEDLVLGNDGNFYGTTAAGGTNGDFGTVFRVKPDGTLTSLVSFNGTNGSLPCSGLLRGPDGNFYGTTLQGGTYNCGTVFQVNSSGMLNSLFSFDITNGAHPLGALALGRDGNLYGTTSGTNNLAYHGTIFRLTIPMAPALQSATVANGMLTLTSSAVAGLQYQVQGNTDLASTNWCNFGDVTTAINGTLTVSDTSTNSQRFYRVVLVQ